MYIHIYVCVCIYISSSCCTISTDTIYICICICMHICIYIWVYIYIYIYIYEYMCISICVYIYMYIYVCVCVYIYIYSHPQTDCFVVSTFQCSSTREILLSRIETRLILRQSDIFFTCIFVRVRYRQPGVLNSREEPSHFSLFGNQKIPHKECPTHGFGSICIVFHRQIVYTHTRAHAHIYIYIYIYKHKNIYK